MCFILFATLRDPSLNEISVTVLLKAREIRIDYNRNTWICKTPDYFRIVPRDPQSISVQPKYLSSIIFILMKDLYRELISF